MSFEHTSSKGGVEYSACFQHSLASWYGQSVHAFLIPKMIWRSLFCGSAFTGVDEVQILIQFVVSLVVLV